MSSIATFFSWWLDELRDLIPSRLRGSAIRGRTVVLRVGDADADVEAELHPGHSRDAALAAETLTGSRLEAEIAAAAAGRCALVACIDAAQVLTRTVDLPAAARENLREVLEFELHRLTPFHSNDVHFEFRPINADRGADTVQVELRIVRKALLDRVQRFLSPHEFRWAGEAGEVRGADPGLCLRLAASAGDERASPWPRRLIWGANAALFVAILVIARAQHDARIEALRAAVDAERTRSRAVVAMREQADAIAAQRDALVALKRDSVPRIEILSELTERLPDSAWIQRLEIKDARVVVTGSAEGASGLIAAIEESALFHGATFAAPVTRNAATGSEQFRLAFEVRRPAQ